MEGFDEKDRAQIIYRALRMIANGCDGARRIDGSGFSKLHTDRGKELVGKDPSTWTEKDIYDGARIARVYANTQLSDIWDEVSAVVLSCAERRPEVAERVAWIEGKAGGESVVLKQPWDSATLIVNADIKATPTRWSRPSRCRRIDADSS